jgi:hypothetical protein
VALRLRPLAIGLLIAGLSTFLLAACGDDDDEPDTTPPPGTTETPANPSTPTPAPSEPTKPPTSNPGTLTPTPGTNTPAGFKAALDQFNKDLAAGKLDPFIARFKIVDYICKASDLEPGLGQPECTTAGEVIRGFQTGNWRSEGGLRKVENVVKNLQEPQADFDTSKSDEFGPGTLRVYAYDSTAHVAVVTVISECLPQFQCESGVQRLVWVPTFEFENGTWKISRLLYAYVLGEEFLENAPETQGYLPNWEKF